MSISQPPPLPGFGLPLDTSSDAGHNGATSNSGSRIGAETRSVPEQLHFPSVVNDYLITERGNSQRMPKLTQRELNMLQFMNNVTDEHSWYTKVSARKISARWEKKYLQDQNLDFSKDMLDCCINELKHKAEVYRSIGCVTLFHGDVVKSDNAIPPSLLDALKTAVLPVANVPDGVEDWRFGSDGTIFDIVDPSLYPLRYGVTRILPDETVDLDSCILKSCGGEIIPCTEEIRYTDMTSEHGINHVLQWLPCDVDISGTKPRIRSYINNLHPHDHRPLYDVIEGIMGAIIPLWNQTLTPLLDLNSLAHPTPPSRQAANENTPGSPRSRSQRRESFLPSSRHSFEHGLFQRPAALSVNLQGAYGHRGLQVIVRMMDARLTPERTTCLMQSKWRAVGRLNEHICAVAVYCYDSANTAPTALMLRRMVCEDQAVGDSPPESPQSRIKHQTLGSVAIRPGRLITFSNMIESRFSTAFQLADPAKPGYCKFIMLYLVDPHIRIISTANVPCQQRAWWLRSVMDVLGRSGGMFTRLPLEIRDFIMRLVEWDSYHLPGDVSVDFPMNLEQARTKRKRDFLGKSLPNSLSV